jgi:hypothetical protein
MEGGERTHAGAALAAGRAVMVPQRTDDDIVLVRQGEGSCERGSRRHPQLHRLPSRQGTVRSGQRDEGWRAAHAGRGASMAGEELQHSSQGALGAAVAVGRGAAAVMLARQAQSKL